MKNDWWKSAVVYQIYPRSFKDSNNDGIGDIPGIISKLDYLSQLGITTIWLSPVYKSPNVDYGYDVADYRAINLEYGTMNDMDKLIKEAKQRHIGIVMDLVLNHTSTQNTWFQEALKSKNNPYHNFYIWRNNIPENNLQSNWEYVPSLKQYYYHSFDKQQADLNWSNYKVRAAIYDVMKFWINKGIVGFRLDVIDLIGKDVDHGITVNGPYLHKYLHEMNKEVLENGKIMTVGEAWSAGIKDGRQYTYPGELSMIFQFQHILLGQKDSKWNRRNINPVMLKKTILRWQEELGRKGWNALFWNNHDLPRASSMFKQGKHSNLNIKINKMLAIMNFFLKGTPFIYQGEEIGMTNYQFTDIKECRDNEELTFYNLELKNKNDKQKILKQISKAGRDNARTPMQWSSKLNAGFSKNSPWINVNNNFQKVNVRNELEDRNSLFNLYRKLIDFRKKNGNILINGNFHAIKCKNYKILAFVREDKYKRIIVIINLENKDNYMHILKEKYKEIIFKNYSQVNIKDKGIMLRPYEAIVLEAF